jgi:hypothetical protein
MTANFLQREYSFELIRMRPQICLRQEEDLPMRDPLTSRKTAGALRRMSPQGLILCGKTAAKNFEKTVNCGDIGNITPCNALRST